MIAFESQNVFELILILPIKSHSIKYEDLTEETTEEILRIQLDDCVKEISITKNINSLMSIRNLFKIAKKFTLIKILVGIRYKIDENDF